MRAVYERETVIGLLTENAFRGNIALSAAADVKPFNDHYLAVFVLQTEPSDQAQLTLSIVSSTVVGIQRYTTKRLSYQGIHLISNPQIDGLFVELLRAHYRGAQQDTEERIASTWGVPLLWSKRWFANGAGDLRDPQQFSISDPDVEALNTLFSLEDKRLGGMHGPDETDH
jgi:hypothetical protein